MKKMNDKGFSLIELIIVIAIMAVLIGVLAPQYLKYVEKSRVSADNDMADALLEAAHAMTADQDLVASIDIGSHITFDTSGVHTDCAGVADALAVYFASDYDVAKSGRRFSSLSDGSSLESETEGKLSYLSVDIVRLKDSPLVKSYAQNESVKAMLGCLDRLNVSIGKNNNAEIELTTKQKLSDIIKTSLKK